jgi:hypothetical protein
MSPLSWMADQDERGEGPREPPPRKLRVMTYGVGARTWMSPAVDGCSLSPMSVVLP